MLIITVNFYHYLLIVNERDTNQTAQANEMLFSLRC